MRTVKIWLSLCLLLMGGTAQAANEIKATDATGRSLYSVILTPAGLLYNGTTSVTLSNANWAAGVTLSEQGTTGVYFGTFPSLSAGRYSVLTYEKAGAAPAVGDALIASGVLDWTGTAVATLATGVIVATNNDKTGYSLSQAFPANFANLSISAGGLVALTAAEHTLIGGTDVVNGLNTVAPGSITAGSAYAKLNSASSAGDPWTTLLTAETTVGSFGAWVKTLLPASSYTTPPTVSQIATALLKTPANLLATDSNGYVTFNNASIGSVSGAVGSVTGAVGSVTGNVTLGGYAPNQDPATLVLGAPGASWNTANTIGAKINSAGSASNPLVGLTSTNYGAGSVGEFIKTLQVMGSAVTLPVTPPTGYGNPGYFYAPVQDLGGGSSSTSLSITITRNGLNQPVISWTADVSATGYKVLRSTNGTTYTVISTTGLTSYTDTARPVGNVYYSVISTH